MKRTAVTVCALVACMSGIAGASWTQAFQESGIGPFDLVAVHMASAGDSFQSPTHQGFSDGGWALLYENDATLPTVASASGPEVTDLTWTIQFAGLQTDPLTFDFVAFQGDTIVDSALAYWDGSGWSFCAGTWQPTLAELTPAAVPAPGALLLGGLGALLVNQVRRRRSM